MNSKPTTISEYIATFPKETQKVLQQVRATIKKAAPDAEETISYSMPCFKANGTYLIYFAGYKGHIGLYALPTGHAAFKDELKGYKQGKGSVQFPLDEPMPLALITRIVKFRLGETKKHAQLMEMTRRQPVKKAAKK